MMTESRSVIYQLAVQVGHILTNLLRGGLQIFQAFTLDRISGGYDLFFYYKGEVALHTTPKSSLLMIRMKQVVQNVLLYLSIFARLFLVALVL